MSKRRYTKIQYLLPEIEEKLAETINLVLDTIRLAMKKGKKRESLQSCSSTATRAFNTLHRGILS